MTVILAILCVFCFGLALPFLFNDYAKMSREMIIEGQKIKELKKAKDEAEKTGTPEEYLAARDLYLKASGKGCITSLNGCLTACLGYIGWYVLIATEIIVIISALALHVGNPAFGYVALAVWIIMVIYSFVIHPRIVTKKQELARAADNTYLPESTPIAVKIFGFIPEVYAIYVLLVIIGLLV